MADGKKNFVIVDVSTGYDNSATSIVLSTGHGARLPNPATANFNLVWWNSTDYANPANDPAVEIVRVTGLSTDTLTVVRPAVGNSYNGETSANTAQNHNTGGKSYRMILAPTYKTFQDLETDIGTRVVANGAISGATKTKITYDAKGLVTSGADATTADIADSTDKRYVTDAELVVIGNTSGANTGDEDTASIKTKLGAASAGADGYLSSTDWSTFNGKAPANPLATDSLWDAKGDVVTGSGSNTAVRTAVGANDTVLTADDSADGGVAWKEPSLPVFGNVNLLKNGNFINNSTNGYGSTGDDWTQAGITAVQGGFPTMTKAQLISLLGISDGDIEGLWLLNEASGNAIDLSSNGYNLVETSGTIAADADGLMGTARDFELGDTEYFTLADASCANLEISGSQTWFCFVKPESVGIYGTAMAKRNNIDANRHDMGIESDNSFLFRLAGLTTNSQIQSDVRAEAGKWYMMVGVYDSVNTKLKLWVNGVKKELTASGSANDSNSPFNIGCNMGAAGDTPQNYFDGLIQCAGVLSVALTDAQVKALFANTLYKGMKARAINSTALHYQYLPEAMVERLRGRTITLTGKMYQTAASKGVLMINDGTGTESDLSTETDAWVDVSVTKTVSTDATSIYVALHCDDDSSTVWWKEIALYEGSVALPYSHSPDDWARFPRLLKMNIPLMYSGKPYQYEENRWYSYSPVSSASGSMTWANATFNVAKFMFRGNSCTHMIDGNATTGGTASYNLLCTPAIYMVHNYGMQVGAGQQQGGTYAVGLIGYTTANLISGSLANAGNWGIGANREFYGQLTGEIL